MSPEKDIVNWWLNRKGFFTLNSIRVAQNKEIDILAIKFGNTIKVHHVEVSCSIGPVGNLTMDKSDFNESVQKFVNRKFEDLEIVKKLKKSISEFVGESYSYEKILVIGALAKGTREKTIRELQSRGIHIHKFEEILFEVIASLDKQNYRHPTIRNLQLMKYMLLSNPEKLAQLIGRKNNDMLNQFSREDFVRHMLMQEEFVRILQKESNESLLINVLKQSSLRKPERLAKVIDEEILSKRTKKKFSEAMTRESRTRESSEAQENPEQEGSIKKERTLSYFLEDK